MFFFLYYIFSLDYFYSLPDQTVPDLMFFESQGAEQYRDDAKMHHFLDTNLYRAKPRVRYINSNTLIEFIDALFENNKIK